MLYKTLRLILLLLPTMLSFKLSCHLFPSRAFHGIPVRRSITTSSVLAASSSTVNTDATAKAKEVNMNQLTFSALKERRKSLEDSITLLYTVLHPAVPPKTLSQHHKFLTSKASDLAKTILSAQVANKNPSAEVFRNHNGISNDLAALDEITEALSDLDAILEISCETLLPEAQLLLDSLSIHRDALEEKSLFQGKYDEASKVRLVIKAGAGGTESCDWVQMLARMYQQYAASKRWQVSLVHEIAGEVTGLKNAEYEITSLNPADNLYGRLKH